MPHASARSRFSLQRTRTQSLSSATSRLCSQPLFFIKASAPSGVANGLLAEPSAPLPSQPITGCTMRTMCLPPALLVSWRASEREGRTSGPSESLSTHVTHLCVKRLDPYLSHWVTLRHKPFAAGEGLLGWGLDGAADCCSSALSGNGCSSQCCGLCHATATSWRDCSRPAGHCLCCTAMRVSAAQGRTFSRRLPGASARV